MRKLLHLRAVTFLLLCFCCAFTASAYDFVANGVYYNKLSSNTVEVTYKTSGAKSYTGSVSIPRTVTYGGVTYTVTRIGDAAFLNCDGVTSVSLPSSITSIGQQSFEYCKTMKTFSFPSSVETLGKLAFFGCYALTKIEIYARIEVIPDRCFAYCTSLNQVYIDLGVTKIEADAFMGSEAINRVVCWAYDPPTLANSAFTSTVKSNALLWVRHSSLSAYMANSVWSQFEKHSNTLYDFENSGIYFKKTGSNTAEVTYCHPDGNTYSGAVSNIPQSVVFRGVTHTVNRIGNSAFKNCSNLTSVVIPQSVTTMGYYIFGLCTKLTTITIPDRVTTMGANEFYGCSALKTVVLGSGLKNIDAYAFSRCSALQNVLCYSLTPPTINENTFESSHYSSVQVVVPKSSVNAYENADYWEEFNNISNRAYDFCVDGIYYTISSSAGTATVVNNGSFNTYSGEITIPEEVSYAGKTYEVVSIGYQAFKNCTGLTKVTLPNTIYYLMNECFSGCTSLKSIDLPSSIGSIYHYAFTNCTNLKSIYCNWTTPVSANTDNFSSSTYSNATVYVPRGKSSAYRSTAPWSQFSTIDEIPYDFVVNGIYYKKTSSSTVEVTYRDLDFGHYSGYLTIPSTVKYSGVTYKVTAIGAYACYLCTGLTGVSLPSTITLIDACAFEKCKSITSITIPSSVTELGLDAFASCEGLKNIIIPNSVTEIGPLAFYKCTSLLTAIIGTGLKTLGHDAFNYCTALSTITCTAKVPPTMGDSDCFTTTTYNNATLHVPKTSLNAYKSADWWRFFKTIVGENIGSDPNDVNGDGEVSISDVNELIDAVLSGSSDLNYDVNGDGEINISDINAIIDAILA